MTKPLFASLSALILGACAGASPAKTALPAMWRVGDPDTAIYLFGTVHLLPDNYAWRTKRFDAVAAKADTLALEIAEVGDNAGNVAAYKAVAMARGLPPLLDRVPAGKRAALAAAIEKAGLKPAQLDPLKTWAAALTLGATTATSSATGASAANGVDRALGKQFTEAGKTVVGLETTPQQFGYFDTLTEAAQRQLLLSMVDDANGAETELKEMVGAWGKGDMNSIAVTFDDELRQSPELADRLVRKRNMAWTAWVRQRLATPGTVLVAVGAGHFAGPDSVIAMLKAQGVKVERVQ